MKKYTYHAKYICGVKSLKCLINRSHVCSMKFFSIYLRKKEEQVWQHHPTSIIDKYMMTNYMKCKQSERQAPTVPIIAERKNYVAAFVIFPLDNVASVLIRAVSIKKNKYM